MILNKKDIIREDGQDTQFRSIFISDIHLGTKYAKGDELLEFFRYTTSQNLYLVGDIIDGWAIRRKVSWAQNQSDVIQKILRKARKGTNVYYLVGNHDEFLRDFLPLSLGHSMQVVDELEYISLKGDRYLVIHGDFFDDITVNKKWLALLSDRVYSWLLGMSEAFTKIRRYLGIRSTWSLSQAIEDNVKKSIKYIENFEIVLSAHAKRYEYYGVICGHIHRPAIREIDGIKYLNTGDWVENCTAIVENMEGEFRLVKWE